MPCTLSGRKALFCSLSLPGTCSSYLVTSYCLVDVSLSLIELSKEFVCFGIPLLDFEILWNMSRGAWKMQNYHQYNGDLLRSNKTFNQQKGSLGVYLFASSYSFASKYNLANKNPLTGFCGKKNIRDEYQWTNNVLSKASLQYVLLGRIIPDTNETPVLIWAKWTPFSQHGYGIISIYDLLLAFLSHHTRAGVADLCLLKFYTYMGTCSFRFCVFAH